MDYKDTLCLPNTEFPMKAKLVQKEPEILERWEKENLYHKIIAASAGRDKFILHDGPPYANGHIHLGTALNKISEGHYRKVHVHDGVRHVLHAGLGLPRPAHRAPGGDIIGRRDRRYEQGRDTQEVP